jgi:hypothetical protein
MGVDKLALLRILGRNIHVFIIKYDISYSFLKIPFTLLRKVLCGSWSSCLLEFQVSTTMPSEESPFYSLFAENF